jgi:two-component system, response regulator FlrC
VFPLHLPPLRERPADIVPLARRFVAGYAQTQGRPLLRLAAGAEQRLLAHAWPGNVRELQNVVQRAVILAAGDLIEAGELDLGTAPPLRPQAGDAAAAGAAMDMKSLERAHIMETLLAVNGSRKLAVARLGISERALRYKLQQYRLSGPAA